jgi:hypothetical protein
MQLKGGQTAVDGLRLTFQASIDEQGVTKSEEQVTQEPYEIPRINAVQTNHSEGDYGTVHTEEE